MKNTTPMQKVKTISQSKTGTYSKGNQKATLMTSDNVKVAKSMKGGKKK